ncbi:MAG: UDP-N-acetylglucosamine--N-acetylmuramyl-(pentapeptide) pyrophosphoryl-undecaprenol N-acetylglucosamine transferase [Fimbriimonadaceae bacterium]|nr:UDP-N-acetylglucosamine--N-acetylmuramyl-(pentapeptide) pyrophosphoryl-undecaprenol N-acetylglucosamine transferase [Fimbriimonadaceae bacterium]
MRLLFSGGGTGGHIHPAVAVALECRAAGHEVFYAGSDRGQESEICRREGIPCAVFPSRPLMPPAWRNAVAWGWSILLATRSARSYIAELKPDAALVSGGYSAAPVVQVLQRLSIPYVVHEQNSVPGRTNLAAMSKASSVATVFNNTQQVPASKMHRTGMPLRSEFMNGLSGEGGESILMMGGSQGARVIIDMAMDWPLTPGRPLEVLCGSQGPPAGAKNEPGRRFHRSLSGEEMGRMISGAALAICRSGAGTLSELAACGVPGIFIPLPSAMGDHQMYNAREFAEMGAGTLMVQKDVSPSGVQAAAREWLEDHDRRAAAKRALAEWTVPDAAGRIRRLLEAAVR